MVSHSNNSRSLQRMKNVRMWFRDILCLHLLLYSLLKYPLLKRVMALRHRCYWYPVYGISYYVLALKVADKGKVMWLFRYKTGTFVFMFSLTVNHNWKWEINTLKTHLKKTLLLFTSCQNHYFFTQIAYIAIIFSLQICIFAFLQVFF